jgi:hypothetical protein
MSTLLIPLAAATAAIVLTWFCCLRPMRRRAGTTINACCPPASQPTDELIRAREELSQLRSAQTGASPDTPHPSRREA